MGIFDIFKRKKKQEEVSDDSYHKALPQFYQSPEGKNIGVITLSEDVCTIMAADPKTYFAEQAPEITEYILMLFSSTKDAIIGELDFYQAMEKLQPYTRIAKDIAVIRALTLEEMEEVLK